MKSFDAILNRNHRVELDKVWETSYTRRGIIAIITYGVASFFMMRIGVGDPFLMRWCQQAGTYFQPSHFQ